MSRKLLINIHLFLASFMAPILIVISISGGLYLMGYKGNVDSTSIHKGALDEFNPQAEDLKSEITRLLSVNNIEYSFDYVKKSGSNFFTRPTNREYYVIRVKNKGKEQGIEIIHQKPDFIKSIVELHKGHGPTIFKTFQKFVAVGLLFVLVTGLWLGLTAPRLQKITIGLASGGLFTFLLFAFI